MSRPADRRRRTGLLLAALGPILVSSGAILRGNSADLLELPPGSLIEREIQAASTDSYLIHAAKDQFIHVQVDQRGADVTLALLAPDGRTLANMDFPNGAWGPEVIALLADSTGDYTVRVQQPGANAATGKYAIRLLALRDATPADRERAVAEAHIRSAEAFRLQRTAASRASALAEYELALPFFSAADERYRETLILNSVGLIYAQTGDMRSAVPRYERALQLAMAARDERMEAMVANNTGGAFDVLGDLPKAHQYYERALSLFRAVGNVPEEANTLNNLGKLYADQGERQKAIEYYLRAVPLLHAAGDTRREAIALGNLGTSYSILGDNATARDYLLQSLERSRAADDPLAQAPALDSLGMVYLNQNRTSEALQSFEEAGTLYRKRGDRRGEAPVLTHIALCRARQGDTAGALDALQRSLELARAVPDRRHEAIALLQTGSVLSDAGRAQEAISSAEQSLAIFRAIGDRTFEWKVLLTLAGAQRRLGNLAAARRHAEESLDIIEQVRGGVGAGESRASYLAARMDAYALAIDLQMEAHDEAAALGTSERARARSLLEMLSESGNAIREGVDPALLAQEKELTNALNARGARLLPLMGRDTPQVTALSREIRELETGYQQVQAAIRRSSPRYAALTQPSPLTRNQIQESVLDADSLLLEYSLGEKRSYLWAVSRDGFRTWELPGRNVIEQQTDEVYRLITTHDDTHLAEASRRLSDIVIAPAASMMAGKRLVLVPDGALQRLPFAMLPLPGSLEPLVTAHEIVTLPSASALAVLRGEIAGRAPAPKGVAVFADPLFDTAGASASQDASRVLSHLEEPSQATALTLKIPRLPYTAQEADRILRVAVGQDNWKATGLEASRSAATSGRLSQYRYIHFATHGFLDVERPSLSALVLAQVDGKRQPVDGFLRVNDIYNTRLSADLVVLSACQTGLGKEVRGEGLMGLTRAFLYAGAPRVIVSLWNVNDRATAELMASLYRGILREGKAPAAALRAAQLELRKQKRWSSPYYWAAFVENGEWR